MLSSRPPTVTLASAAFALISPLRLSKSFSTLAVSLRAAMTWPALRRFLASICTSPVRLWVLSALIPASMMPRLVSWPLLASITLPPAAMLF
ncbi:hypothetical protein D3C84_653360 [compost metagenome]